MSKKWSLWKHNVGPPRCTVHSPLTRMLLFLDWRQKQTQEKGGTSPAVRCAPFRRLSIGDCNLTRTNASDHLKLLPLLKRYNQQSIKDIVAGNFRHPLHYCRLKWLKCSVLVSRFCGSYLKSKLLIWHCTLQLVLHFRLLTFSHMIGVQSMLCFGDAFVDIPLPTRVYASMLAVNSSSFTFFQQQRAIKPWQVCQQKRPTSHSVSRFNCDELWNFYSITNPHHSRPGSRAACGSLPGFLRLLRNYEKSLYTTCITINGL